MNRNIFRTIAALTFLLSTHSPCFAQLSTNPAHPNENVRALSVRLYSNAQPYMDEPLSELKKNVHELAGLRGNGSQEQLPVLLGNVAQEADHLVKKIPNLISDEVVNESQWTSKDGLQADCAVCAEAGARSFSDEAFNYLILIRPEETGSRTISEYRTLRNGKELPAETAPHFQRFFSSWVIFYSANQPESRFRYLGEQQTNGHKTFVIGFAQMPSIAQSPGTLVTAEGSVPLLLQGIAWVDQSDFRIVRLHTDLLAPQLGVDRQSSDIAFGPAKVNGSDLWLPDAVNLEMESKGHHIREIHRYSKYRLYQAKSKIIYAP